MEKSGAIDLISIIIPVYNVEHSLPKCIESIINQTYKNLEIILIDDGATDASGYICDDYEKKDSRILVIHKKNGGLSDARNAGIDVMKGKYVAFIDSDDCVSKYFIERLYNNLKKTDADISITNFIRVNEDQIINDKKEYSKEIRLFDKRQALNALYDSALKYQFTMACGKLISANIFENIRYPRGRNYEDTATAHLIFDLADRVVYADIPQYFYLIRETSITKSETHMKDDAIWAVNDRVEYFKNRNYDDLLVRSIKQYMCTVMGVYARASSKEGNIRERKKEIFILAQKKYKEYRMILNADWKMRLRICLFLAFPNVYSWIIKKNVRH